MLHKHKTGPGESGWKAVLQLKRGNLESVYIEWNWNRTPFLHACKIKKGILVDCKSFPVLTPALCKLFFFATKRNLAMQQLMNQCNDATLNSYLIKFVIRLHQETWLCRTHLEDKGRQVKVKTVIRPSH